MMGNSNRRTECYWMLAAGLLTAKLLTGRCYSQPAEQRRAAAIASRSGAP